MFTLKSIEKNVIDIMVVLGVLAILLIGSLSFGFDESRVLEIGLTISKAIGIVSLIGVAVQLLAKETKLIINYAYCIGMSIILTMILSILCN